MFFLPFLKRKKEFLENLLGDDPENVVKLLKVAVSEEEVIDAEGPLRHYVDRIVKKK